ncbi:hypothetical protein ACH5RR_013136 [Cinchona calisaya]|uniref:Uncharacterized protein n=1 Tax=Cinchona calisaya TaxID=153742 RepID=A0ABD3A0H8_9GENT
MNLRCPTLSHFKWYKETFLARVMNRVDCNSHFWKEKIILCLPSLLAQRIFTKLKDYHDGYNVPYGDIVSVITEEGLKLCNDIKLKDQIKKYAQRKELGDFCAQFAVQEPSIPYQKAQKQFKRFSKSKKKIKENFEKPYFPKKYKKFRKKKYRENKKKIDQEVQR